MIQKYPKIKFTPLYTCPDCDAPVYEEIEEHGNYHPEFENIWYEKVEKCSNCDYYNYPELKDIQDYEDDDSADQRIT